MRTIYLLLFPLFLFFIVSCTEDEVDPNFSIENVGDVVMGSAKGLQVTISFTGTVNGRRVQLRIGLQSLRFREKRVRAILRLLLSVRM